jgi:ABC-type glycerol-3-phosphate transport system substrate-binding protein
MALKILSTLRPSFRFDGKYYGLPNDVAPEVLFYNKELCQGWVDPTIVTGDLIE